MTLLSDLRRIRIGGRLRFGDIFYLLLGLFHRGLEVLLDHFDFLLNEVEFGLDGFPKVIRGFL